jgi:hypothetical protein
MPAVKKYLTPSELIERWGGAYTYGTLANKRSKREGPPFAKFGAKVLYPIAELEDWEAKNKHLVATNDNEPSKTDE